MVVATPVAHVAAAPVQQPVARTVASTGAAPKQPVAHISASQHSPAPPASTPRNTAPVILEARVVMPGSNQKAQRVILTQPLVVQAPVQQPVPAAAPVQQPAAVAAPVAHPVASLVA